MDLSETKNRLLELRIPERYLSIVGDKGNDQYVIDFEDGRWITYYLERGHRSEVEVFFSEQEACNHFFEWVVSAFSEKKPKLLDKVILNETRWDEFRRNIVSLAKDEKDNKMTYDGDQDWPRVWWQMIDYINKNYREARKCREFILDTREQMGLPKLPDKH